MSYVKKTWANGDTITSAALNNIEDQVAINEPLHVPFTVTAGEGGISGTTTATFAEVAAAVVAGKTVIADVNVNDTFLLYAPVTAQNPAANPTGINFGVTAKTSNDGKPTLYQIGFESDESVGVTVSELT